MLSALQVVQKTSILVLYKNRLEAVTPQSNEEKIVEGWVTIGHEVRSFEPCGKKQALWLMGDAPALKEIINAYGQVLSQATPYQKLLMIIAGELDAPPTEGFGADYEAGFKATRLMRVSPDGNCMDAGFNFDSKASQKLTFDLGRLDAYGMIGTGKSKRALAYEFCIPDTTPCKDEVLSINPTLRIIPGSPGRIGCRNNEYLCVGSTFQPDFKNILHRLADLAYIQRIDESFFE